MMIEENQKKAIVQRRQRSFRYAFGMFGTSIPINMFKTFAAIYYVDTLGVTTKYFSFVLMLCSATDLFGIFLSGYLSDKLQFRFGKRRPWILFGTPLLVGSFIAFFHPMVLQKVTGGSLPLLLGFFYLSTAGLDAMINVNYGAVYTELFPAAKERIQTNSLRQIFQMLAMIISIALTPIIVSNIGYQLTSIIYGLLAWAVIWYSTFGYQEKLSVSSAVTIKGKQDRQAWLVFLKNKHLWQYGLATLCYSSFFSLFTQGLPFFVKYRLHLSADNSSYLLCGVFLLAILGIIVWRWATEKISYEKIWHQSYFVIAAGLLVLLFAKELYLSIFGTILAGFGMAGSMVSSDVVGSNLIDEFYRQTGRRLTGLFTSFFTITFRVSGFCVGWVYYFVEVNYHFVNGANPGNNPESAAVFLFSAAPLLFIVFGGFFSYLVFHTSIRKDCSK